jgi:hypothetical protein
MSTIDHQFDARVERKASRTQRKLAESGLSENIELAELARQLSLIRSHTSKCRAHPAYTNATHKNHLKYKSKVEEYASTVKDLLARRSQLKALVRQRRTSPSSEYE